MTTCQLRTSINCIAARMRQDGFQGYILQFPIELCAPKCVFIGVVAAAGVQSISRFVIVAGFYIYEFYSQHNIYKLKQN